MSTVWNKLDSGLSSIYLKYLQSKEHGAEAVAQVHPVVARGGRVHVSLQYSGDLAKIEALGFQTVSKGVSGQAIGKVDLANLERLASHPGVLKMSFGRPLKSRFDNSVPDIRVNQIWSVSRGVFSRPTGARVISGGTDTEIDSRCVMLLTSTPKGSSDG